MPQPMSFEEFKKSRQNKPMSFDEFVSSKKGTPSEGPEIIEEMHPSIKTMERAIIKNLSAGDPDVEANYLRKKHPNLEFTPSNGRMLIRDPKKDKKYHVLDPDTGMFSSDLLPDILDIGYDAMAATTEGLATAGGAIASGIAAAPTVVGAAPAALAGGMAAGAATTAGNEALRQKLGQWAGLEQEVSGTDVVLSGAIGATSPLLFGAGVGAKQAVKQSIKTYMKKGLTEKTAKALGNETAKKLVSGSRGAAGRAYKVGKERIFPSMGEWISGAPKEATQALMGRYDELAQLSKEGITDLIEQTDKLVKEPIAEAKAQLGKQLETTLTKSDQLIDLNAVKAPIQKYVDEMKELVARSPTDANKTKLAQGQDLFNDIFTVEAKGVTRVSGAPGVPAMQRAPIDDLANPSVAFRLKEDLADAAEMSKLSQGQAMAPRFAASATRSERQLMEAARKSAKALDDTFDAVTGGMSKEVRDKYKTMARLQRDLKNYFGTPEKTYRTMSGLDTKGRRLIKERIEEYTKRGLIPPETLENTSLLQSFGIYDDPSWVPLSIAGSTSTSRSAMILGIGRALGATAGAGFAGAEVGGPAGTIAGVGIAGALASPRGIRLIVKALRKAERAGKVVDPRIYTGLRNELVKALVRTKK